MDAPPSTSTNQVFTRVTVVKPPHTATHLPFKDIEELKALLIQLLKKQYNTITSSRSLPDQAKEKLLIRLASGSQHCGQVEGVYDVSQVEELVANSRNIKRYFSIPDVESKGNGHIHVVELYLPKKIRAVTEWISAKDLSTIQRKNGNRKVNLKLITAQGCGDDVDCILCLNANEMEPVATDLFHFIVYSREDRDDTLTLQEWSPGEYLRRPKDYRVERRICDLPIKVGHQEFDKKTIPMEAVMQIREDIARATPFLNPIDGV